MSKIKDIWLVITNKLSYDELKIAQATTSQLEIEKLDLSRHLRSLDHRIFELSQCTNQSAMQKIMGPLVDEMMARKSIESKRITNLLQPEIEKYGT